MQIDNGRTLVYLSFPRQCKDVYSVRDFEEDEISVCLYFNEFSYPAALAKWIG